MNIPKHVAIIMDGNGRWAEKRNMSRNSGHRAGIESVREVVSVCVERKIPVLTLFAFSRENWGRPNSEVNGLMSIFIELLYIETTKLHEHNIRLKFIGERNAFSQRLKRAMYNAEKLTKDNDGLQLVIAMNYSGRWDIMQAAQSLASDVESGQLQVPSINENIFQQKLSIGDLPDPDLFIRTSGEQRISNFLLWNLAYTELYFTETLWPDFKRREFELALEFYSNRERRFGLTPSQTQKAVHG